MCAGRRISFERRSDRALWAIACLVLVGFALAGIGVRLAAPAAEEVRDLERQLAALLPQTDIDEDNYVLAPYDELVVVGPPSATSHWSGVQADGTVPLGGDHQFGRVHVAGMQLDEAASAISAHLAQYFDEEPVTVTLGRNRSKTTFFVNCGRNWWLCQLPYEQAREILERLAQLDGPGHSARLDVTFRTSGCRCESRTADLQAFRTPGTAPAAEGPDRYESVSIDIMTPSDRVRAIRTRGCEKLLNAALALGLSGCNWTLDLITPGPTYCGSAPGCRDLAGSAAACRDESYRPARRPRRWCLRSESGSAPAPRFAAR